MEVPTPDIIKPYMAQIEELKAENKRLEEQLERWQDEYCKIVEIRNSYVSELRTLKVMLETVLHEVSQKI